MSFNLKEKRQALEAKRAAGRELAASLSDDMTDEEFEKVQALQAEIKTMEEDLKQSEQEAQKAADKAALRASLGGGAGGSFTHQKERVEDDPNHGFKHFGEFCEAVRYASRNPSAADDRLKIGAAPTTYGNESAGTDGGFLVPPGYGSRLFEHSIEEDAFLPMTDNQDVPGNSMTFPKDETTPWSTDGIQVYWDAEADQATQSKPKLSNFTMRLNKLMGLVPMTEELLTDAGAMGGYVQRKLPAKIRWTVNNALVNGNGAGKPKGIANAGCLVTQAKETSQSADTIVAGNVVKMFSRNSNPGRAVWLVHHDAYPQLPLMTIGDQPIFTPPNQGIKGAPAGMLLGRPVYLTDTCQTLGDLGDIYFVDWMGMASITKAGGIQTATSMHLWFDYDMTAFRATFRVDAQPWMSAAIDPANGSATRSPFVTLAARA